MGKLDGKKIAILATDGVEQVELTKPREALDREGATTELVGLQEGEIQGFAHLDHADRLPVDRTVQDVSADDYDGILIPGGVANGDFLRADAGAVKLVAAFAEQGKPIASICHGPWILVEAGIVKGRTVTSWPSLQTDIRNAGGTWVDEEVHVNTSPPTLVTSRKPDDIPAFSAKAVEEFAEGRHEDMPQPSGTATA
jgi:protease I